MNTNNKITLQNLNLQPIWKPMAIVTLSVTACFLMGKLYKSFAHSSNLPDEVCEVAGLPKGTKGTYKRESYCEKNKDKTLEKGDKYTITFPDKTTKVFKRAAMIKYEGGHPASLWGSK